VEAAGTEMVVVVYAIIVVKFVEKLPEIAQDLLKEGMVPWTDEEGVVIEEVVQIPEYASIAKKYAVTLPETVHTLEKKEVLTGEVLEEDPGLEVTAEDPGLEVTAEGPEATEEGLVVTGEGLDPVATGEGLEIIEEGVYQTLEKEEVDLARKKEGPGLEVTEEGREIIEEEVGQTPEEEADLSPTEEALYLEVTEENHLEVVDLRIGAQIIKQNF